MRLIAHHDAADTPMKRAPESHGVPTYLYAGSVAEDAAHTETCHERPNIALAAVLISCPVAIVVFVALLATGNAFIPTMLMTWAIQLFVFCAVLVKGFLEQTGDDVAPPSFIVAKSLEAETRRIR